MKKKEKKKKKVYYFLFNIFLLVNNQKSPIKRRSSSLKEDFAKIKAFKPEKEEEELCSQIIAETMKNTLYNKVVGGFAVEN